MNLLAHTLLVEDAKFVLIDNFEELLCSGSWVRNVQLQIESTKTINITTWTRSTDMLFRMHSTIIFIAIDAFCCMHGQYWRRRVYAPPVHNQTAHSRTYYTELSPSHNQSFYHNLFRSSAHNFEQFT